MQIVQDDTVDGRRKPKKSCKRTANTLSGLQNYGRCPPSMLRPKGWRGSDILLASGTTLPLYQDIRHHRQQELSNW